MCSRNLCAGCTAPTEEYPLVVSRVPSTPPPPTGEELAPVCAPLSTTEFGLLLSLPSYTKSWICHRGPIMFAEVVFTSPVIPRAAAIPPSFPLPRRWISDVSLDRDISFSTDCFLSLLVTLSLAKLLCFFASGLVLSFFLIGGSKFQNDERLSCDLKRGQLVQDGIIDD